MKAFGTSVQERRTGGWVLPKEVGGNPVHILARYCTHRPFGRTWISIATLCGLIALPAPQASAFDPLAGDFSKDDPLDVRIVSYNHHERFIEDPSYNAVFNRILIALGPDIICFQEFGSKVTANTIADRLNSILPVQGGSWQVHLGLVAGTRTVIASRFSLTQTRTDTIPTSSTRGVTLALADLPDATYPHDVYLLGVHLKCCGDPGGSEDASRQDSADAIANWLGDARGVSRPSGNNIVLPADTPMIALGDFNLVGGPQPESTLITGNIIQESTYGPDVKGDWDNSDITDLAPADPFTGDTFTWQSDGTYPPSRLDRMFYTDSRATVAHSFVLNTNTMTPAALAAAGLQAGDTLPQNSSDHLPIAMDLRIVTPPPDCNGNGVPDACEISCGQPGGACDVPGCGTSADCNINGIPDTCEPDTDCDGVPDACDLCPNTIVGSPVDASGCPPVVPGDFDRDGDVDATDLVAFQDCASGPAVPRAAGCEAKDFDNDHDVDQSDFGIFQRCLSGEDVSADPNCAN